MRVYRIKFKMNGQLVVKDVKATDMIRLTAAVDRKGGKIETQLLGFRVN
jgi:hypothetical protein